MVINANHFRQYAAKLAVDIFFRLKKILHSNKKSVLIYTDSRGFYVNKWYCKKNPLFSYIGSLAERYCVDYRLCNYQHTTLLDFLADFQGSLRHNKYDVIILHLGVVDFSPRPASQALKVLNAKKARLSKLYHEDSLAKLSVQPHPELYEGGETASLYTKEFLAEFIVPEINKLPSKVIWIGVNRVLPDWNGNYSKKRPSNINCILEFQNQVDRIFSGNAISLLDWSDEEIKKYTVDNIHLSIEGFNYLHELLLNKLQKFN